ncbi:hypothetical protein BDR03DRAFT_954687 [Suillus americanus]|nr:hypothetical protein BDR03DRAFT_954687 [Suillus americanus]
MPLDPSQTGTQSPAGSALIIIRAILLFTGIRGAVCSYSDMSLRAHLNTLAKH